MYAPSRGWEPGDLDEYTEVEVECPRCKGTCEDRHGNDCRTCDGLGTVLVD